MIRTQIQLTEEQAERLKDLAHERGVSVSALVREAVDGLVREPRRPTKRELRMRALEVAGKYSSGRTDIAEHHDRYLAEIYAEDLDRRHAE